MPVVTKVKVKSDGTLIAGQFIEDSNITKFNAASEFYTGELNEVDGSVKITSDNKTFASQFVEE